MNEKKKCPYCGLLIDSDMEKCPYCGNFMPKEEPIKQEKPKIIINDNPKNKNKDFLKFYERRDVSNKKEIAFFLINLIGLQAFAFFIQLFTNALNPFFMISTYGSGILNFSLYLILFGIFAVISLDDYKTLFSKFFKGRTYLYGISYGFLVIVLNALYSMIVSTLYPGYTSNQNENSIESIVAIFPALSLLVFGFIGPICEEMGYRVGLFSLIRKKNRILAYVLTSIVFGFIHFNFTSSNMAIEFINLPSYMISGILFCYIYDKEGVETSMVAHITNNVFAIMMTIISTNL